MSEGFLDGSAICLYIASACVGVYSKGEFVRIEVDRYTDFSDIKEGNFCLQTILSLLYTKQGLNRPGLYTYFSSVLSPLPQYLILLRASPRSSPCAVCLLPDLKHPNNQTLTNLKVKPKF